ncbi:MAG: preprotein translocase subunit SecA [Bacteroidia bacterium]|nr:preprotein translocase subunit SecA [Bacteroidia bacterium]
MGILSGIMSLFGGSKSEADIRELKPIVDKVNAFYPGLAALSNDELRGKTLEFRARIREHIADEENKIAALKAQIAENAYDHPEENEKLFEEVAALEKTVTKKIEEVLERILPEAFAVVKETARRLKENEELEITPTQMDRDLAAKGADFVRIEGDKAYWKNNWMAAGNHVKWDMVHYDVQLIGGSVLHKGRIAEMTTGEGKTLVATLPVYLNALPGRGVHVVTVNDYLARRDSEWNGPLFQFHGLTVDCIDKHQPNSDSRKAAYEADITYGTNNEFGFDYLRDNMVRSPEELVQRKHNYAIVDEVDSVLVDDARTPLIISGPTPKGDTHEFDVLRPRVEKLVEFQRKLANKELAEAKKLLESNNKEDEKAGGEKVFRAHRGLPKNGALIKFLSEPGVRTLMQKTENHFLQDQQKEMHKIDDELFFVIDEKNNSVDLTDKGISLISENSSDPNFFIIPDLNMEMHKLESMGLDKDELLERKETLLRDYTIKSERIHSVNQLLKAYALFEKDVDYVIMDGKVKIVDEQTGRILDGRRYSDGLHQAIEAKENVKVEAATQTYATITLQNYFRMYNKLAGMTGTAETEAKEFWDIYKLDVSVIPTNRPIQRKDMEDLVYKTKREKYNAVIEQIEKYVSEKRPVLVGTTSVEISELLSRMLTMKGIRHQVLNAKLHQKEAEIVAEAGKPGTVTIATNMAGRGTDIKLGEGVKEAGGLAIIGTERHDSRRVDRQLRGRAGRQGDPGTSQFFVSLEDDLMRLFGSERIARLMDSMGYKEGEVLTHSMITRSIERAQKKVEENNFGIRKRLLEYDDVMNQQREVIYTKRRNALFGDKVSTDIYTMLHDVCENLVNRHSEARDFSGFEMDVLRILGMESPVDEAEFYKKSTDELSDLLLDKVHETYRARMEHIRQTAMPVISDVFKNQGHQYTNIVIPVTDGIRGFQTVVNLEKAFRTEGKELTLSIEKGIMLALIDNVWKEHLRDIDDLKQSVQNAVFEQKDPLLIYKLESFNVFKEMVNRLNEDVVSFLMKAFLASGNQQEVREAPVAPKQEKLQTSRPEEDGGAQAQEIAEEPLPKPVQTPVRAAVKVGRNDACPCGSGKKYKNCHGAGVNA